MNLAPAVGAAATVALAVLAVAILWELHDLYLQVAQGVRLLVNQKDSLERLHDMVYGALGLPNLPPRAPGAESEGAPDQAKGKIYAPEGWGDEEEELAPEGPASGASSAGDDSV